MFDNLDAFPWLIEEPDRALARLVSSYWVNFVRTGNPNGAGLPDWPSFRTGNVMKLDAPPSCAPEEGRDRHLFLRDAAVRDSG